VNGQWSVEFFEDDEGGSPVQDFLDDLDKSRRAKVVAIIALLAEQGPHLPFPYSSHLRGKIRELRTQYGKDRYRVLYFGAPGRRFILLHALGKSTAKVPEGDIRVAEARIRKCLERLQED
jgi:phage-related protein